VSRRRQVIIALVVAVVLAGAHFLYDHFFSDRWADDREWVPEPGEPAVPDRPPVPPKESPDGPGTMRLPQGEPAPLPENLVFDESHARAFAWLARQAAGDAPTPLDRAAAERLPLMRELFARHQPRRGRALALVSPAGVFTVAGPFPDGTFPPQRDEAFLQELAERLGDGGPIPEREGVDEARRFLLVKQVGAVRNEAEGRRVVAGPGVWAALRRPAAAPPTTLAVEGDAAYAVSFHGEDFGTVRLDGGLVAPGRFYRVEGTAVITGGPVGIHVRPLETVPAYHEAPVIPPEAAN